MTGKKHSLAVEEEVENYELSSFKITLLHAWIILGLALVVTAIAWNTSKNYSHDRAVVRFNSDVDNIVLDITKRMSGYEQVLQQTRALISIRGVISRREWRQYYQSVDFDRFFPGTQAFGLTVPIARSELSTFGDAFTADGFSALAASPDKSRELYHATLYIEPFDERNARAYGYDMYSEPTRRATMDRAIDTGLPSVTGRVTLAQETRTGVQPGFLFFMPIYKRSLPREPTVADRRTHLLGIAYTSLRTNDLLKGVLGHHGDDTELTIYDASDPSFASVLFESANVGRFDNNQITFTRTVEHKIYGHTWRFKFSANRSFILPSESQFSYVVAIGGILLSLMLFWTIRLIALQQINGKVIETRALTNIADSEQRFRVAVNATNTGLMIVNEHGIITMVNQAIMDIFGYARDEILGKPVELLVPPQQRLVHELLRAAIPPVTEQRRMMSGRNIFARSKDGHLVPVEITLAPIDIAGGKGLMLASVHNITEQHANEAEREQTLLELRRSNNELEQFAHASSHDLKAPLRAIDNLAKWIAEDAADALPEESKRHFEQMRKRILRMEKLLDDLLVHGLAGRDTTVTEIVDLKLMVGEIAELADSKQRFTISIDGNVGVVKTFRTELFHVLLNLVSNAVKHHHQDSGSIQVSCNVFDGLADFRVSDDGPGIPAEFRSKIFEMYQTLRPRDQLEASGMGLATAKKLVEKLGGEIEVMDNATAGACFHFTFPATMATADPASTTSESTEPVAQH